MSLEGKNIILAITGSIAAYKTPQLVRLLVKAGARVKVVLTPAAADFVSPLALATVSQHPVFTSVSSGAEWNNHVALGRWADLLLVAPCSANTLAKIANGICDNMVLAVYLSAACPVAIAPAMDEDMWLHRATQRNLEEVEAAGHYIIPVGHGELASGLIGPGRMAEVEEIITFVETVLSPDMQLSGKKALITAGPTYEAIDPVRFIGNHASGKMGIALAQELAARGVAVELVLGPVSASVSHPLIQVHQVTSAREMYACCTRLFPGMDIAIMSAAVADFRPVSAADEKIKKRDDQEHMELTLVKNPDILARLGKEKQPHQLVVGFALETHDELAFAEKKLKAKNADLMVVNSLRDEGAGFGHDTNKVTLLDEDGTVKPLPLLPKREVATAIVEHIIGIIKKNA